MLMERKGKWTVTRVCLLENGSLNSLARINITSSQQQHVEPAQKGINSQQQVKTTDVTSTSDTLAEESPIKEVGDKDTAIHENHEDQSLYEVTMFHDQVVEHQNAETDNSKAIMVMPKVVQANPIQVVSPKRVLYDIVSHNIEGENTILKEINLAVGVPE